MAGHLARHQYTHTKESVKDPLEAAWQAHRAALDAQEAMRAAARKRDEAVREARAAGISAADLAEELGVNRHRIHAMTKTKGDTK